MKPYAMEIIVPQILTDECGIKNNKRKKKTIKERSHTRPHFTQSMGALFCQLKLEIKGNSHILVICHFISNFNFSYHSKFPQISQSNFLIIFGQRMIQKYYQWMLSC